MRKYLVLWLRSVLSAGSLAAIAAGLLLIRVCGSRRGSPAVTSTSALRIEAAVGLLAGLGLVLNFQAALSADTNADTWPKGDSPRAEAHTNRLFDSNNPYLLLHARNPVDWYPWGEEALAKARRENKPIFLSIGYSTCYWCHVAERTIYARPEFARMMNAWFVNIKVDTEQRPDLDRIYMLATRIMTGKGGWPNNLFLTPDLKPFFAGSYFPPHDDEFGRKGFSTILRSIHGDWNTKPGRLKDTAQRVHEALRGYERRASGGLPGEVHPEAWLSQAAASLARRADKIVVGLNGLAIEAFAESAGILARPEYLSIARRAGEYLWGTAYDAQSASLRHEIFRGRAQTPGFLDDYALLARGYLSLHGATGEPVWRARAAKLADAMLTRFARADGTLMTSEREGELLIAPIDDGDNAYPSGTSAAVDVFLRLAGATSNAQYAGAATRIVRRLGNRLANEADAWSTMVVALNANRFDPKTAALPSGSTAAVAGRAVAGLLPPDTRDHVRLSAKAVQQADHYRIEITVKIDAGYHINANPASFDYLIPTSVSFDGVTPASITYPEPVLFKPRFARGGIKVYEGNPTLTARIAKRDVGDRNSIRATVAAQACDAEICLPPSKLEITIPVAGDR